MIKYISILLTVASLVACNSTINQSDSNILECSGESWVELGHKAGMEGKKVRSFDKYINQCGDKLDPKAKEYYVAGYSKGLKDYCSYENGYNKGVINDPVLDICPFENRAEFNRGHKKGLIVHKAGFDKLAILKQRDQLSRSKERMINRSMDNTDQIK